MRLLLDSQALYLWLSSTDLPNRARSAVRDQRNHVHVSVASLWELGIKANKGKLPLSHERLESVLSSDFEVVRIGPQHAVAAAQLPPHHRDPFDRMLIAQAQIEGLTLVGGDAMFAAYDVPTLWD